MAESKKETDSERTQRIREEVRKMLLRQGDYAVRDIEILFGRRLDPETVAQIEVALNSGDYLSLGLARATDFDVFQRRYRALRDVHSALKRLREGGFGLCQNCGERINPKRLKVIPSALCCIDCQKKREEREKNPEARGDGLAAPRTGTEG